MPIDPPGADAERRRAGKGRIGKRQMRLDPLVLALRREQQAPVNPAPGQIEHAAKPARITPQRAMRTRPRNLERGNCNRRPPAMRQQDLPVRRERPEPRLAARAIIEPRRAWHQRQPHIADPERVIGASEQQLDRRPLDMPVEHHPERPVLGLAPGGLDMEGPVLAPITLPRQPQFGRIELQVRQVQNPVLAPHQIGGQPRQAPHQRGEEAVVEPPHPRLRLADDPRMPPIARNNMEVGEDIDDPQSRD